MTRVAELCPARAVARRDVYRQLVFAWVTGNGDVHSKNISVLRGRDGEWKVSPAYDLPSTVFYNDRTLALPLAGKLQGISRKRLLDFAVAIDLPEKTALRVLDQVVSGTANLCARARGAPPAFPGEGAGRNGLRTALPPLPAHRLKPSRRCDGFLRDDRLVRRGYARWTDPLKEGPALTTTGIRRSGTRAHRRYGRTSEALLQPGRIRPVQVLGRELGELQATERLFGPVDVAGVAADGSRLSERCHELQPAIQELALIRHLGNEPGQLGLGGPAASLEGPADLDGPVLVVPTDADP